MIKIKKGNASRISAIALVFIMIINLLPCLVGAEENTVSVSRERFLTDEMYVYDGIADVDASQNVIIELYGSEPSVSMSVSSNRVSSTDNSLRIVLDNASLCESMQIDYMYKNTEGVLVTKSVECSIVKGNGAREYIVPMESPSTLASLKFSFKGAASGSVTFISIGTVSHFVDNENYCGSLTKNEYDPASSKAYISGTVSWETVSRNTGAKVVVYALGQNEKAEDIKDKNAYIAYRDISLNYDISIDGIKTDASYSQYLVAVLTSDGEILPIAPEFYLSFRSLASVYQNDPAGFKGIETALYGGAIEAGSSFAYVDVYLDRLFSYDESGFQYIVDGNEYYVDKDYVTLLDKQISTYRADGVAVYLRLLISGDGYAKLFFDKDYSGNAKYYSVDIYDENVFSRFMVYSEYIISRYSSEILGNISGVILGRALDLPAVYNYGGGRLSTNEYAERVAKTSVAIRSILDKYGADRELILPFSDGDCAADTPIVSAIDGEKYPINILASSILKYIDSYGISIESLYFMLESASAPIVSDKGYDDSGVGDSERSGKSNSLYAPIVQTEAFEKMLSLLSSEYPELPDQFVYCWYVGEESAVNNYIYNYNVAASIKGIRGFLVSFADAEANEATLFSEIKSAYKLIDTDKNEEISSGIIKSLGLGGWGAILYGYNSSAGVKRTFLQMDLKNSIPSVVNGSYKMWNYGESAGANGWQAISGCDKVSLFAGNSTVPRALELVITENSKSQSGSEYGSAIFSQQNLLKVSGICGISFNIFVPKSSQEKIYEVLITVESVVETVEFSGVVFCGSETVLYADIENIDTVRSIKVSARELSSSGDESQSIYIKNISIHSNKYGDGELEKMVLSGNLTDVNFDSDEALEELAILIMILIVVISISLLWLVRLIIGSRKHEK